MAFSWKKLYFAFVVVGLGVNFALLLSAHKFSNANNQLTGRDLFSVESSACLSNADCGNGVCFQSLPPVCQCNPILEEFVITNKKVD